MLGFSWDWSLLGMKLAMRIDQLERVKQAATLIALITPSVFILTSWACAFHETICQETVLATSSVIRLTVWLYRRPLVEVLVLVQLEEDVLCDIRLLLCWCPTPLIESNVEPLIHFGV